MFTVEDLEHTPQLLMQIMSWEIDYKVWFRAHFPNNASGIEEVKDHLWKESHEYALDPVAVRRKYTDRVSKATCFTERVQEVFDEFRTFECDREPIIQFLKDNIPVKDTNGDPDVTREDIEVVASLPNGLADALTNLHWYSKSDKLGAIAFTMSRMTEYTPPVKLFNDSVFVGLISNAYAASLWKESDGSWRVPEKDFHWRVTAILGYTQGNMLPLNLTEGALKILQKYSPKDENGNIYFWPEDIKVAMAISDGKDEAIPDYLRYEMEDFGMSPTSDMLVLLRYCLDRTSSSLTLSQKMKDENILPAFDSVRHRIGEYFDTLERAEQALNS